MRTLAEVLDALTDKQIRRLREKAGQAGDLAQVAICDRALAGDDAARRTCAEVVWDAEGNARA